MIFSIFIFLNDYYNIFIRISPKLVSKDLIDNKIALIQIMARRRTGDKPLTEQMMAYFTVAYIRDLSSIR